MEFNLSAEIDSAQPNDIAQIVKSVERVRSAVRRYDKTTSAHDQRVDSGVIEMSAIGKIAIARQVVGLRKELPN